MDKQKFKISQRVRRKRHIRKKVYGNGHRPRLTVFRSLRHIYAQIIDDDSGFTLVAASTLSKDVREETNNGNVGAAAMVGQDLARKALGVGIRQVCFDRNGYKYHGRLKALADAAREGGLKF